uniref:Uncharacterized protein n=1 Tax=Anguilla anguilla TaxID=7936 RepID=A0A0E9ULF8_ANGAN
MLSHGFRQVFKLKYYANRGYQQYALGAKMELDFL